MNNLAAEAPRAILWDVMSTLVYDPFLVELPGFFGMSFKELIQDKDPHAWPRFERGELDEESFWQVFFKDRRAVDDQALRQTLYQAYRFEPGMQELLARLKQIEGLSMHTMTNYPDWWRMIEQKLELSRYVDWTFISCEQGLRKPNPEAYLQAARLAGQPPEACLFIDDRQQNCDAAQAVGMRAVRFVDSASLSQALVAMGFAQLS